MSTPKKIIKYMPLLEIPIRPALLVILGSVDLGTWKLLTINRQVKQRQKPPMCRMEDNNFKPAFSLFSKFSFSNDKLNDMHKVQEDTIDDAKPEALLTPDLLQDLKEQSDKEKIDTVDIKETGKPVNVQKDKKIEDTQYNILQYLQTRSPNGIDQILSYNLVTGKVTGAIPIDLYNTDVVSIWSQKQEIISLKLVAIPETHEDGVLGILARYASGKIVIKKINRDNIHIKFPFGDPLESRLPPYNVDIKGMQQEMFSVGNKVDNFTETVNHIGNDLNSTVSSGVKDLRETSLHIRKGLDEATESLKQATNDFHKVSRNIDKNSGEFSDTVDNIKITLQKINETCDQFKKTGQHGDILLQNMTNLSQIITTSTNTFFGKGEVVSIWKSVIYLAAICFALTWIVAALLAIYNGASLILHAIMTIFDTVGFVTGRLVRFFKWLIFGNKAYTEDEHAAHVINIDDMRQEIGEDAEYTYETIISVIAGMFKQQTPLEIKQDRTRIGRITGYFKLIKMGKDSSEILGRFFKNLINDFSELFFGVPWLTDDEKVIYDKVIENHSEMVETLRLNFEDEKKKQPYRFKVYGIKCMADELKKMITEKQMYSNQLTIYLRTSMNFDNLYEQVREYERTDRVRPEPLVVQIDGAPGTGKSYLMKILVGLMVEQIYGRKFQPNDCFNRKPGTEYWEGYNNNFCVVYDDLFQSNKTDDRRLAVTEIIYACNTASYQLNMAHLESKACTFFTSKMIMITTNLPGKCPTNADLGILDTVAFRRRRDIVVKMKNEAIDEKDAISLKNYKFDLWNPKTEVVIEADIGFERLFYLCMEKLYKKQTHKQGVEDFLYKNDFSGLFKKTEVFLKGMKEEAEIVDMNEEDIVIQMDKEIILTLNNHIFKKIFREGIYTPDDFDCFESAVCAQLEMNYGIVDDQNINTYYWVLLELSEMCQMSLQKGEILDQTLVPLRDGVRCFQGIVIDTFRDLFHDINNQTSDLAIKNFLNYYVDNFKNNPDITDDTFNLLAKFVDCDNSMLFGILFPDSQQGKTIETPKEPMEPQDDKKESKSDTHASDETFHTCENKSEDEEPPSYYKPINSKPRKKDSMMDKISSSFNEELETFVQKCEKISQGQDPEPKDKIVFDGIVPEPTEHRTEFQKKMSALSQKLREHRDKVVSFYSEAGPYAKVAMVVGMATMIISMANIILHTLKTSKQESGPSAPKSRINEGGQKEQRILKSGYRTNLQNPQVSKFKKVNKQFNQEMYDQSSVELVESVKKQIVTVHADKMRQKAVLYKPGHLITTHHFTIYAVRYGMSIEYLGQIYNLKDSEWEAFENPHQDLALIKFKIPKTMPTCKNITNQFILERDRVNIYSGGAVFCDGQSLAILPVVVRMETVEYAKSVAVGQLEQCLVVDTFVIRHLTRPGACGALYALSNNYAPRKFFGIHVAGNSGTATGVVITQEKIRMMEEASMFELVQECEEESLARLFAEEEKPIFDITKIQCSNVKILGTVKKEFGIHMPNTSKGVSTCFNGSLGEPQTMFTQLRTKKYQGEVVSPLAESLKKKLFREANNYFHEDFSIITQMFVDCLPKLVEVKAYDDFEVTNHPYDNYCMHAPEMSTSRGFDKLIFKDSDPLRNIGKGKHAFLERDDDGIVTMRPEFMTIYHKLVEAFPKYLPDDLPWIFVNYVKDERLAINKHYEYDEDGFIHWLLKYRIISAQPLAYLQLEKRYLGAFYCNVLKMNYNGKGFCDLGNNPYSVSWSNFIKSTMLFGEKTVYLAGDFSSFDASIPKNLMKEMTKIICEWYKDDVSEEHLECIRKIQYYTAENVTYLAGNVLYQTPGTPSGRLMTCVLNSMVVTWLFMLTAYRKKGSSAARWVFEHIHTLGDDHILPTHRDDPLFTMFDVQETANLFGMKYTSVYKDKPLEKFYSIEEVKYLQRSFHYDPDRRLYFGTMDKQDLEEICMWGSSVLGEEDRAVVGAENSLREAFLWGKDYFEDLKKRLNRILKQNDFRPVSLVFKELDDAYFGLSNFDFVNMRPLNMPTIQKLSMYGMKEESGREERLPVVGSTTVLHNLTAFEDNVDYVDATPARPTITSIVANSNPFEDATPRKLLTRLYNIGTVNWTSAQPVNTTLGTFEFPKDLLVPNIIDKLNSFCYFRSGITVELRLNTTTFNSGCLMVAYTPCFSNNESGTDVLTPFSSMFQSSCLESLYISANSQNTVSFTIPYTSPHNYWDMNQVSDDVYGIFGVFKIWVIAPLSDGLNSSTVTVPIDIWAKFEQPETTGFDIGSVALKGMKQEMEITKKESTPEEIMNKSVDQKMEQALQSDYGLISDIGFAVSRTAFKLQSIPMVGGAFKTLGNAAYFFSKKAYKWGLSYPTNVSTTDICELENGNRMCTVHGVFNGEKLALQPDNIVSNDWKVFCTEVDYSRFGHYKRIPGIFAYGTILSSDTAETILFSWVVSPLYCFSIENVGVVRTIFPTPLANIANKFQYWRGDIQYCIKFFCNSFVSFRGVIYWDPYYADNGSIATNRSGDVASKVVDVQGDTVVTFTIPYLQERPWLETMDHYWINQSHSSKRGMNGVVKFQLLSPIYSSQTATASVHYVCFVSGGSSFEVAKPRSVPINDKTVTPGLDLKDMKEEMEQVFTSRKLFSTQFDPIIPASFNGSVGVNMGDNVDSWVTLMKRFTLLESTTVPADGSYVAVTPWAAPGGPSFRPWWSFQSSFLFHRGSIRLQFVARTANTTSTIKIINYEDNGTTLQDYGLDGVATWNLGQRTTFGIELPFYTNQNMFTSDGRAAFDTNKPEVKLAHIIGSVATVVDVYIAVGDDYSCGVPMSPQLIYLYLTPENKKQTNKNDTKTVVKKISRK